MAPAQIALEIARRGGGGAGGDGARDWPGDLKAVGPYLNVFLDRGRAVEYLLAHSKEDSWGSSPSLGGRRVMVEFSCPNTNKPLHLGHLRNNVLGEALARFTAAAGAEVKKVNLINDRGIHICNRCSPISPMERIVSPETKG
jgi:arginyl-tRNA synthetase